MIRTVLHLARSSPLLVLFLAAAILTLTNVLSDAPDDSVEAGPKLATALAPVPKPRGPPSDGAAALRIALFDPERRPETISGSIDDLRGLATAPPPAPANVAISGVLLDGPRAKAMLNVIGGPVSWTGVGAEIGGWRVASIDAAGAVLEHDGQNLVLKVADRWKTRGAAHGGATGGDAAAGAPTAPDPSGGPPAATEDTLVPPDPVDPSKP